MIANLIGHTRAALGHVVEHVRAAVEGRSPHWPECRRRHLEREPACAACGAAAGLQVHHVVPFHVDPSRELDDANLVTLCEAFGRRHHFVFGHNATSWSDWNPEVRTHAAAYLALTRRTP